MRAMAVALGSLVFVGFLGLGLFVSLHPMWLSELRLVPGNQGDTIFSIFLLEHQWQWLIGAGSAPGFWDPPIGYPMAGALAHGDIMLSFAPLYWPWRALGSPPETAYEFWVVAVLVANYAAMWALLRGLLGIDRLGAGFGACLFAFSGARMAQIGHVQLLPQFFVLGALASVLVLVQRSPEASRDSPSDGVRATRESVAIGCYAACVVAQFWGAYYMGYFIVLISAGSLVVALSMPTRRRAVLARLRERQVALFTAALVTAGLLLPLATRYLEARAISRSVGVADGEIRLPRLASYFFMGSDSLLYGWMASLPPFANFREPSEQAIGLGFVTTGVLLFLAWRYRRQPETRFVVILVLVFVVALTWFPFEVRFWRLWYYTVPGIGAIRAISRIGILLAIPAAIALARFVTDRRGDSKLKRFAVLAIAMLCLAEQSRQIPVFDKRRWTCEVDRLVGQIDPRTSAFHVEGNNRDNIQALVVAQRAGIPTVNLFAGAFPKAWTLFESQVRPGHSRDEVRVARRDYLKTQGVDPASVQVLAPVPPEACPP